LYDGLKLAGVSDSTLTRRGQIIKTACIVRVLKSEQFAGRTFDPSSQREYNWHIKD